MKPSGPSHAQELQTMHPPRQVGNLPTAYFVRISLPARVIRKA